MTVHTDTTDRREITIPQKMPGWAAPIVLSVIMVASGIFFLCLAQGISILSSIGA